MSDAAPPACETRACSKCQAQHSRRGKSRWHSYCLSCHRAYMRENRTRHSQLTPEARMKANTRSYTNVLKRRGKLEQGPCSVCGDKDSQAHHPDYSDPRNVVWMCRPCHLKHHDD